MNKIFLSLALFCSIGIAPVGAIQKSETPRLETDTTLTDLSKLALRELQDGLTLAGLKHEHKVIQLYSLKDAEKLHSALGPFREQIVFTLGSQHAELAEKLLLDAIERTKLATGKRSVFTQAQIADLFVFYVHRKDYADASRVLDQILDFDLSTGPTPTRALTINQNVRSRVRPHTAVGVVHLLISTIREEKGIDASFAQTAIDTILKAQENYLQSDDERLVETISALADEYFQAKQYDKATDLYSRAYKIANFYHPESALAVSQCGQNFLANLRECGRFEEADRLSHLN